MPKDIKQPARSETAPVQAAKEPAQAEEGFVPTILKTGNTVHEGDQEEDASHKKALDIMAGKVKSLWGKFEDISGKLGKRIYYTFRPSEAGVSEQTNSMKGIQTGQDKDNLAKAASSAENNSAKDNSTILENELRTMAPNASPEQITRGMITITYYNAVFDRYKNPEIKEYMKQRVHKIVTDALQAGDRLRPVEKFDPEAPATPDSQNIHT